MLGVLEEAASGLALPFWNIVYYSVQGLNASSEILGSVIRLSVIVGQLIVNGAVYVLEKSWALCQALALLLQILYEDYCIFLLDVISKFDTLVNAFSYIVIGITSALSDATTVINGVLCELYCYLEMQICLVFSFIGKTISLGFSFLEVLRNSLVILGSGIWCSVCSVPCAIIYVISFFIFMLNESYQKFCCILSSLSERLVYFHKCCALFFTAVPDEAVLGLLIGFVVLSVFLKYHVVTIHRFSNVFISLRLYCRDILSGTWDILKLLITHILPERYVHDCSCNCHVLTCDEVQNSQEVDLNNVLCVICKDKEKCVIVLPCRHLCLCINCSGPVQEQFGVCPICRQIVEGTMMVYT